MRRSGSAVGVVGLILTLLLVGCATENGENGEEVGDEDVDSEVVALRERVAELEEERDELIVQRDSLQDEVADLEGTPAGVEAADDSSDEESDFELVEPGETVRFNDWIFQVTDWKLETSIGRADPPRGVYLVVTLDVENDGSTPRSFLGGVRASAIVSDGNVLFEYDSQASLAYYHSIGEGTWHRDDIGPGLSDTLRLVFDIGEGFEALVFAVLDGEAGSPGVFLRL